MAVLFDGPDDYDAEYEQCGMCQDWFLASAMLGPAACLACGAGVITGAA